MPLIDLTERQISRIQDMFMEYELLRRPSVDGDGDWHALNEIRSIRNALDRQPVAPQQWTPIDFVANDHAELHADELAVTIGMDDTGMATFAWPVEGEYAVCKLTAPATPQEPLVVDEADNTEMLDYDHWLANSWWPDNSTHATADKEGGCCWWHGEPALASIGELGWEGDLVERYYDPAMPFDALEHWYDTLRQRPTGEGGGE